MRRGAWLMPWLCSWGRAVQASAMSFIRPAAFLRAMPGAAAAMSAGSATARCDAARHQGISPQAQVLETQCTKNRTDDEWLFPELDQEGEPCFRQGAQFVITAEDVRETLELALGNQPIPSGAILTEVHESIDTESQASEDTANSLMLEAEHAPPAASQQVVANLLTNMLNNADLQRQMMSTMCRDPMYGELLRRNPGLMAQHNLPPMLPASYPVNIMDDAQSEQGNIVTVLMEQLGQRLQDVGNLIGSAVDHVANFFASLGSYLRNLLAPNSKPGSNNIAGEKISIVENPVVQALFAAAVTIFFLVVLKKVGVVRLAGSKFVGAAAMGAASAAAGSASA